MTTKILITAGILLISEAVAIADGDAKRGASVYRACVACHSLEPGVHLTGPSRFHGRRAFRPREAPEA